MSAGELCREGVCKILREQNEALRAHNDLLMEQRAALMECAVVSFVYTKAHETDYAACVHDIVKQSAEMVLDPAISKEARALQGEAVSAALTSLGIPQAPTLSRRMEIARAMVTGNTVIAAAVLKSRLR